MNGAEDLPSVCPCYTLFAVALLQVQCPQQAVLIRKVGIREMK
jgi:hypothetical protein